MNKEGRTNIVAYEKLMILYRLSSRKIYPTSHQLIVYQLFLSDAIKECSGVLLTKTSTARGATKGQAGAQSGDCWLARDCLMRHRLT